MQARTPFRHAALAFALGLGLAPAAHALDFVFTDVGATPMTAQQFLGFQAAANYWKGKLSDNVTVYLSVGFDDLGANTLGTTTWDRVQMTYGGVRSLLTLDASSAADASAVSHLQPGSSLSFTATQPDKTTRLDNDGSINNRELLITSANAKALGQDTVNNAGSPDAVIKFATGYASQFAYSRINGGVPANQLDFITLAEHEIGHALGFVSGVDGIDRCIGNAEQCGTAGGFDGSAWYYPLDLFRYSAPGSLNVAVGGAPYLSLDGGASAIQPFSTGQYNGDGRQASHFANGTATLLRPVVPFGQSYDASTADLLAVDAIGWNLTTAVPEPQTYALLLSGLAVLGWARSRLQLGRVSA